MNSNRRKALQIIIDKVEELKSELETLMDEEQEYFDNMPESFQRCGPKFGMFRQFATDFITSSFLII